MMHSLTKQPDLCMYIYRLYKHAEAAALATASIVLKKIQ